MTWHAICGQVIVRGERRAAMRHLFAVGRMHITFIQSPHSHAALALGAAFLAGGCTSAAPSWGSAPGVSLTGTVATAYIETHTVSLALDRIDQRDMPLDHTYRHFGSGKGVTVYVFDGGVLDTHPDLVGRVRRGYDAFPSDERMCNAHGTAVAGAVAGTTLGVAPEADIVDVKMVDCRRLRGTIEAIVRGTRWALADHARHPGTRAVANWSFIADTAQDVPALDSAVRELRSAGIPVIVSAGNLETNACRISPANAEGTIVVGASRVHRMHDTTGVLVDDRAPGTAFGPCIDVFAPGDSVLLPSMDAARQPNTQLWTGTSMAAGYVSGAVALYLEAHPFATAAMVEQYIHASSGSVIVDPLRSPLAGMLYVGPAPLTASRVIASRR
jgi:subtilisin family serine protease